VCLNCLCVFSFFRIRVDPARGQWFPTCGLPSFEESLYESKAFTFWRFSLHFLEISLPLLFCPDLMLLFWKCVQCKTLYCQIFELVLFSFSQVTLIVIILKICPNRLIAATITYLFPSAFFCTYLNVFVLFEQSDCTFGLLQSDCYFLYSIIWKSTDGGVTQSYFN